MAGTPPVHKFKLRGVEVAIWKNTVTDKDTGDKIVRYSTSVQKSYRNKETGEYETSRFLFPEELAVLSTLSAQAVAWIAQAGSGVKSEEQVEEKKGPF